MDALRGLGLVLKTPRLWPLCLLPLLGTVIAYIALGVIGGFLLVPHIERWLANSPWRYLAEASALVVWILLFPFLFVLLGGVFFGLIFEPLARQVETGEALRDGLPTPPPSRLTVSQNLSDSMKRLLLNGGLGFGAFLFGFILGPVPGVLAAAVIGLLDATAPSFLLRGRRLGEQIASLRQAKHERVNILTFALVVGILSLVPFLGILLLPGLVAGGTLLVRRLETLREESHTEAQRRVR